MRNFRRLLLFFFLFACLIFGVFFFSIPKILQYSLRKLEETSKIETIDFKIDRIGRQFTTLKNIHLANKNWTLKAKKITLHYTAKSLLKRQVKSADIEGLSANFPLSIKNPTNVKESKGLRAKKSLQKIPDLTFFYRLPFIRAENAIFTVTKGQEKLSLSLDCTITLVDKKMLHLRIKESLQGSFRASSFFELEKKDLTMLFETKRPLLLLQKLAQKIAPEYSALIKPFSLLPAPKKRATAVQSASYTASLSLATSLESFPPEVMHYTVHFPPLSYQPSNFLIKAKATETKFDGTLEFSSQPKFSLAANGKITSLSLPTKGAIGMNLNTTPATRETPIKKRPKWKTTLQWHKGDAQLSGEITQLFLHGKNHATSFHLDDSALSFIYKNDALRINGQTTVEKNTLPFQYEHQFKQNTATLTIPKTPLRQPITQLSAFAPSLRDVAITGILSAQMPLTLTPEKIDGALTAELSELTLTYPNDGAKIENLQTQLHIPSLVKPSTKAQKLSIEKIIASDIPLTNTTLQYTLQPNKDIFLSHLRTHALGGAIRIAPFTLPADQRDYTLQLGFEDIDLKQLLVHFPKFDGTLTGRINGTLPIKKTKNGFFPQHGQLRLASKKNARLQYNAHGIFTQGLDPKSARYKTMQLLERSLSDLKLEILNGALFNPKDTERDITILLNGKNPSLQGAPPVTLHLNIFKPEDNTSTFQLLLKNRDKLEFGF